MQGSSTPEPEFPDLPYTDTAHDYSTAPQRISHDVAAAYIDAEVAGRTFHRGSGEAHYVRLDTYPKFEGYTLEVRGCCRGYRAAQCACGLVWLYASAMQFICCWSTLRVL